LLFGLTCFADHYNKRTVITVNEPLIVSGVPQVTLAPKGNTTFGFWETPRGNPPALRAWLPPGDNYGQEFVYPKGLAATIAHARGNGR
jgi:hypothetical protein